MEFRPIKSSYAEEVRHIFQLLRAANRFIGRLDCIYHGSGLNSQTNVMRTGFSPHDHYTENFHRKFIDEILVHLDKNTIYIPDSRLQLLCVTHKTWLLSSEYLTATKKSNFVCFYNS